MHKLGLVSISFRKHAPEEILAAMQGAGLSYIEWGSDVHAPCDDEEKLHKLVTLQAQYGVICSSYGTYFRVGQNRPDEIRPYIRAAKILGTHILRVWVGDKNFEDYDNASLSALLDDCKQIAAIAAEESVVICAECHNKTLTSRLGGALALIEAAAPHFRMYWQPNQFRTVEENLAYAEAVAAYTEIVHVFQWKEKDKFPLETGIDEWRAYLDKLPDTPPLLLEFMPDNELSTLPVETASLRRIVNAPTPKGDPT